MPRVLFWGLFGLTIATYAAMLGWSLPFVTAAAGGLVPFDLRPGGYSLADARAFLGGLSSAGAEFYVNVQQKLDIAYPGLLASTLLFSIGALLPRRIGTWRWVVGGIALPVALFDYLENHAVAQMIEAGSADLTADLVATASQWTVLKAGASTLVMSVVLVLLLWKLGRRLTPKSLRRLAANSSPWLSSSGCVWRIRRMPLTPGIAARRTRCCGKSACSGRAAAMAPAMRGCRSRTNAVSSSISRSERSTSMWSAGPMPNRSASAK